MGHSSESSAVCQDGREPPEAMVAQDEDVRVYLEGRENKEKEVSDDDVDEGRRVGAGRQAASILVDAS